MFYNRLRVILASGLQVFHEAFLAKSQFCDSGVAFRSRRIDVKILAFLPVVEGDTEWTKIVLKAP
jgi:hypothetical protein